MKTLTNLSATTSEGECSPRGFPASLHYEDETCKGWFIEISLSHLGLKFKAKRPDGASVAIPLSEIMTLVRAQAPEIFASPEAIAEATAAEERRAEHSMMKAARENQTQ